MPPKHKVPKRTTQLPASLRAELVSLGKLPETKVRKEDRKERRKAERAGKKQAKAGHFNQKRASEGDANRSGHEEPPQKRQKVVHEQPPPPKQVASSTKGKGKAIAPEPVQEPVAKKKTALEKMLEKQERGPTKEAPIIRRAAGTKADRDEDDEIGWLEAALGVRNKKGKIVQSKLKSWDEDGLGDLFEGLDQLETALFAEESDGDDANPRVLPDSEEGSSDEEAEYGVEDGELIDPSDDDDHEEMGEIGSERSSEEALLDDFADFGNEEEDLEESDEEEEAVKPTTASVAGTSAAAATRYVPPHLRNKAADAPAPPVTATAVPTMDPRLRSLMTGQLNKLAAQNMMAILSAFEGLYREHPRAVVSSGLTTLLMTNVRVQGAGGESMLVIYAAFVAALGRVIGIEFSAGVVAQTTEELEKARKSDGGESAKEAVNLMGLLGELYNFGVIACGLVYDYVREFVNDGLREADVELLVRVIKRCGAQLRHDDPASLKEIVSLVKQKSSTLDSSDVNSRTKFMIEQLANLKNNRIGKLTGMGADGSVDHYTPLKKMLSGLNSRSLSAPEPLRISLADLRSSNTKGKWWLVGAAWAGDPLVEAAASGSKEAKKDAAEDKKLKVIARDMGMNTDVRRSVFAALMNSEDYVDACDNITQLGLTEVQQREVARVLLQCCGNEKAYNPFYTLVTQHLCGKSHGFQITMQYLLWDFLRELGETSVGGEETLKNRDESERGKAVPKRRVANLARLYGWCVAKGAMQLSILKPVPFTSSLKSQTRSFMSQFFVALIVATQTTSPLLVLPSATRRDRPALERTLVRVAADGGALQGGIIAFLETGGVRGEGDKEEALVDWGLAVITDTLGLGGSFLGV